MANLKAIECWSTTKASNDSTDSPQANMPDNLNAAEYKQVIRGMKASAAATIQDIGGFNCVTTGTSTAYILAQARDLDTAANGILTMFTPHTNCGADPTLAVGDIAATAIKTQTGGAIAADDLVAGSTYFVRLNTTATPDEWRLCGVIAAEATDLVQALFGTTANFRANDADKILVTDDVIAAAAYVALSDAVGLIAWDMDLAWPNASITLDGNHEFSNPTNVKEGTSGFLKITQDGTGSRVPTWGTNFDVTGVSLTTTAAAVDLLTWHAVSATLIVVREFALNVS